MPSSTQELPASIRDEAQLDDLLSIPTPGVIETVRSLPGDYIILGVGGKMGPTLARMLKRALDQTGLRRRVIGVSRFGSGNLASELQSHRIETIACDLLDQEALDRLPDVQNVIYMAGMKFGSTGNQARTWAMNTYLAGMTAQKFRHSRIAAFSTGNVYPLVSFQSGGAKESDDVGPIGEYAMSCLGRERIFEHFSRSLNVPITLLRLNYAVEMRYGVLADMARKIVEREPIDLAMGHFNMIWQADANAAAIESLRLATSPPVVLNLTGPEVFSIREVCQKLGKRLGKEPIFTGTESGNALLNNASKCHQLLGKPSIGADRLIEWTADWVSRGGSSLGKPTHFETRDGKF